jgi:FkbM family methyltransferase
VRTLIDTRLGRMLVNDKDAYVGKSLLLYGDFSNGEAKLFSDLIQPGWVVTDVGANIGAHTVLFSRLVGDAGVVFAFEPQRLIFQMLCANLALNGCNNVHAMQAAIGAEHGLLGIASLDPDQPNNFGGWPLEAMRGEEGTTVMPLTAPCHFLKIDVEGMEAEVLRGAAAMLAECAPWIYVENDRLEKSDALIQQVRALGYTPYWHITPLFDPANFRGITDNLFGAVASINMLCAPPGSVVTGMDEAKGGTYQDYIKERDHARTQPTE